MNSSSKAVVAGLALLGMLAVGYFLGQDTRHPSQQVRAEVDADLGSHAPPRSDTSLLGKQAEFQAAGSVPDFTAPRLGQSAAAGLASSDHYLPLEAGLLTGGYLNPGASELLGSKRFDAFFERFEAQNFGTTDELTSQYRSKFEKDFQGVDAANTLQRLSCATDVCIATIRSGKDDARFDSWYGSVQSTSPLPIMALTQAAIMMPGGAVEHRVMFTTSRRSGGFALGTHP